MLEKILESTAVKILVLILGLLSGIARLIATATPNQPYAQAFSLIGLGIVVAYIIYLVIQRLFLRSARRTTYLHTASRYGVGFESLDIDCIIDKDGSAVIHRKIRAKAFAKLSNLDTFLLIPEEYFVTSGQREDIDIVKVESLTPGRKVTRSQIKNEFGKLSVDIDIAPPLQDGEEVHFEMIEKLPEKLYAIDLTAEELKQRKTPHDYFGWTINRPTQKLNLNIYFPKFAILKDYGAEVLYASVANFPLNRINEKEQNSLDNPTVTGPEGGVYELRLSVDDPVTGLIYVLRWQPLQTG